MTPEDHEDRYIPGDVDAEIEDIPQHQVPPELIASIKKQVLEELKDDDKRKAAEKEARRNEQQEKHRAYVAKMKASPDPWVEIVGWVPDEHGVRIELEWNDPFITVLRQQGITGADEDQVVQKWLIMLMHDLSQQSEEESNTEYE